MRVRYLAIGAAVGASALYMTAARNKGNARELAEIREALQELGDAQASTRSSLARQVESLQRGQEELLEFVRSVLDDEALAAGAGAANRRRVVSVSMQVEAGQEVMRGLMGSFCDGIGMDVVLQAEPGTGGRGPYLVWHPADGRPLENVLAALLAAVPREHAEPAPDSPGLDELRRLVLALHDRGPGTIRIGPLILNSTPGSLLGRVVSPRELAALGTSGLPGPAGLPAPGTDGPRVAWEVDRWLRGLGPGGSRLPGGAGALELAPWAEGYRFFAA
jgi:hypothetical protein